MKLRKMFCLGSCAILLSSLAAQAQDLGAAGAAAGAAGAPPPGANLFTMLLPPPDMVERCRVKLCKCEIVKMLRSSLAPAAALSGGLVPVGNCCPTVKKEDLAKPADSSEGAAARIKKDVEEAAARRAAVRYLGTVDCRYWPEAEQALIDALRADKIECVRYEAAIALQRGCCCTKKVAKALTISIEGSEKDGHPAERSARVQDAAAVALSNCVFEDMGEKKDEIEAEKKKIARVDPKNYYRDVDSASNESVYGGARKALESRNAINSTQVISQSHRAASQGLIGIFSHAVESTTESAQRANGIREQQMVVATYPQQPQRRGLLYKLLPGSGGDEAIAYNPPAQLVQPVVPQPVAAAQTTVPTSTIPQAKRLPMSNEIRPVGYVAPPTYGTMSTDDSTKGFSTSGSSNTTPRPITPTSSSSSAAPRPEGLLGLVITNDANRR